MTTQHHHHARRAYTKHPKQTKYTHPSRRPSDIGERNVARLAAQQNIGDVVPVEAPSARSHMIRFRQKFVNRTRCDETIKLTKPSRAVPKLPHVHAKQVCAQRRTVCLQHVVIHLRTARTCLLGNGDQPRCMHPVACIQLHASQSTIHLQYNRRVTQCAYMYKQCHASKNNTRTIHTRTIQYKGSGPGQRETGRS